MAERYKLYVIDYSAGKIVSKNKKCPRCGSTMAFHKSPVSRWHCGKCNYVEFVPQKR